MAAKCLKTNTKRLSRDEFRLYVENINSLLDIEQIEN